MNTANDPANGAKSGEASGGAKKKVLIVDDEEDFTMMIGLTLRQTGKYETRAENDASRAVDSARAFGPDLILLDVMMPEMDGGDVLLDLQRDPATRHVPVIFLTALVGGEESPVGGLVSGGHCFVPKPVSLADLSRCMEQVLSRPALPPA